MTGLKLTIPGAFTDSTLPKLRNDPVMSSGSLALFELGHPAIPVVGVPANGDLIPNIAQVEALALMPGKTATELAARFERAGLSATGKVERTGKGGLHVATGIADSSGLGVNYAGIYGRASLAQYILDNMAHEFFVSYWGVETRIPQVGTGAFAGLSFSTTPSASNLHWAISHDSNNYPSSARKTGSYRTPTGTASQVISVAANPTLVAPFKMRFSMGIKATDGSIDRTAANVDSNRYFKLFSNGRVAELFTHSTEVARGSGIHYRTYIEDLTVSGRSHATVDALDAAEYSKQVLTAGGRYYGDTFTDPATIS